MLREGGNLTDRSQASGLGSGTATTMDSVNPPGRAQHAAALSGGDKPVGEADALGALDTQLT